MKLLIDRSLIDGWLAGGGTAEFIAALQELPEAKMLDLGGLESHPIVEWYTMWGASDEQELVRVSDLTNAAEVPIPTMEEIAEVIYQEGPPLLAKDEARYMANEVHKLLTAKGVKHG